MWRYYFIVFTALYSVAGKRVNLALMKPALQNSKSTSRFGAAKAVDGDKRNGNDKQTECAFTGISKVTWWQVDLGKHYLVSDLVITKRAKDNGLQNLTLTIHKVDPSNKTSDSGTLCCIREKRVVESQITLRCENSVEGRYLRITKQASKTAPLILCEVQVYGHLPYMSFMENTFQQAEMKTLVSPHSVLATKRLADCATYCLQMAECDKFQWEFLRHVCKLGGIFTEASNVNNSVTYYCMQNSKQS